MPRIIQIDPRVPATHGVLIPRLAVEQHTRVLATVNEARAYARRIVKEAQAKVTELERQAIHDGFQAGWIDSMNVVFHALSDGDRLQKAIESSLKASVQNALKNALENPELELQLLDSWLNSGPRVAEELQIILPKRAQHNIEAIKRRLEQSTGVVANCIVGETDNVIIQSGEQIYEFAPTNTYDELGELTDRCIGRLDLRKQCEEWSSQIVNGWLSDLALRHNKQTDDEDEESFGDEFFDDYDDDILSQMKPDVNK